MLAPLTPEMMDVTEKITAPKVLVDSEVAETPEEIGFDFAVFHDTVRSAGVTDEQVTTNTIRFTSGDGTNLGLYKQRQTDIYINTCTEAARKAAASSKPIKPLGGYLPFSSDVGTLVNDVTVHETGHFVHDMLHPGYTARMRALKLGAAATVLSPVAMLVDVMQEGPYHEAAPVGIGISALVIVAGGLIGTRYNPMERPAIRFQKQYGDRQFVNFLAR